MRTPPMARPQTSPILSQLRSAKTLPEQAAALQALKNEIVGHVQKKEAWIRLGVLEPIVRALSVERTQGKPNGKESPFKQELRPLSEEDSVKLQALQLIASFSNGGPAFLAPLDASGALPAILSNISPITNPPQITVAALKTLVNFADASTRATSPALDLETIADHIFASQHIESIAAMMSASATNHLLESQKSLVMELICKLCREERHQQALASGGILDLLAMQLASFAVRDGYVVPGAEKLAAGDGLSEVFPESAAAKAKIGPVLEALAAVLGDSKYRATRFINSPAVLAVFPRLKADRLSPAPAGSRHDIEYLVLGQGRPKWLTAMEYILPAIPVMQSTSSSASQSPYASTPERSDLQLSNRSGFATPVGDSQSNISVFPSADVESPVIPWLVHLVRSLGDHERLMAASVLTALFRAGLGTMTIREKSLGLLVVPILLQLISKYNTDIPEPAGPSADLQRLALERSPAILARLITDCEYLQKAAYECDAVKILTRLLKQAYQPVPINSQPQYWSPNPDTNMDIEGGSPASQLGAHGDDQLLAHRVRVRESVLKAIGSLSATKEDYRKAVVAEDCVSYVVESLSEFPGKPQPAKDRAKEKSTVEIDRMTPNPEYGKNPLSVIIAACYVVRMLARSVSVLRTALVDHAVALPVSRYMRHPDVNVQIAATATVINLIVEVSPVRELLTENGVMKVLCEHAHSDNPALRLDAMWALKHFVDAVSPDLKKACLEQLEPGWLIQLISDDDEDSDLYSAGTRQTPADDLDEDMEAPQGEGPFRWLYARDGVVRELDATNSSKLRQVEDYLSTVRESELNPARRARNDDLAIQEQGLDFIRNLIGRPYSGGATDTTESPDAITDVVDYLFSALGQDRLFEILASKLRSRVVHPFSRRTQSAGREAKIFHPRARIVHAVIYILVHIAASIPRHRQLVISQRDLLRLVGQQSSSKDREVRLALCHLIINLTWGADGDSDGTALAQRARELKALGFHTKMEALRHQDRDLDVRERAKMAAWQLEQATY